MVLCISFPEPVPAWRAPSARSFVPVAGRGRLGHAPALPRVQVTACVVPVVASGAPARVATHRDGVGAREASAVSA